MKIVVTTPTGHVGSRVIQLLVQAGVTPTVLARDESRLPAQLRPHLDIRTGSLGDAAFVRSATVDADALYWVDPTDFMADDPIAETIRLGSIAADAITANRIAHVVFQSSVGTELRHGAGLIDGLSRVEELFDATTTNVVHLRCGYFFVNLLMDLNSLRRGVLTTAADPSAPMPWVDPRDIGEVAAARLLARSWTGRQVQAVHGPADLSWYEVRDILGSATGRPFELTLTTDDKVRDGARAMGMSELGADGLVLMTAGLRDLEREQPRTTVTTTPTTLAGWAHDVLRPLLID